MPDNLEGANAQLRAENERLIAATLSTFAKAEDVMMATVGRWDASSKEGSRFIDLNDPMGLRKLAGLPGREGRDVSQKLWGWYPVRMLFVS